MKNILSQRKNHEKSGLKEIIAELIVLTVTAVLVAVIVNLFSPVGIAWIGQWDTRKGVVTAVSKNDTVHSDREIELPDAKRFFEEGWLFVDARSPDAFAEGHIQGAVNLSVLNVEDAITVFAETYAPETPIVVYCSGRECSDSHEVAQFLFDIGFSNVKVFIDGFPLWKKEGLPVE